MRFLLHDGILLSVDGWIDAYGEDMLMVLCQNAWIDDVSVVAGFAWINIDAAHDAGSPSFDVDVTSLVKLVVEDVFVVGQRDDELDDKLTISCDDSSACTPICMLPSDTVILLV